MKPTRNVLVAILIGLSTTPAFAQRDAGSKIRGDAYRPFSARSYNRGALDHARVLNYYSRSYQVIPTETAQEHAAEVRRNLDLARKEAAKLKPQAKSDPTVAKHLAALNKHYDEADRMCSMLVEECAKADGDTTAIMECCSSLDKSLQAADAEHEKLMKHLGVPPVQEPKQ